MIDRELYLPQSWTSDPGRCAAAGIPEGMVFAIKPELALRMISRALDAGTSAGWVTGDEVYGADPGLRPGIEDRRVSYVLAVAKNQPAATTAGFMRADVLAARLPTRAWPPSTSIRCGADLLVPVGRPGHARAGLSDHRRAD